MCYLKSITWGNISEALCYINLSHRIVNLFKLTRILSCNWHLISYTVMALAWRELGKTKLYVNVVAYFPWSILLVFLSLSFLFGLFWSLIHLFFFSLYFKNFILYFYQVNGYSKIINMHSEFCVVSFWALRGPYNDFIRR